MDVADGDPQFPAKMFYIVKIGNRSQKHTALNDAYAMTLLLPPSSTISMVQKGRRLLSLLECMFFKLELHNMANTSQLLIMENLYQVSNCSTLMLLLHCVTLCFSLLTWRFGLAPWPCSWPGFRSRI
ncbi:hypothetical protein AMTRI_Chr06g170720 [Amborella trichopoda]